MRVGGEEDVTTIRRCYCPSCEENHAIATVFPTSIPFFREIIIMAVACNECHYRNSEVKFGGELQEQGQRIFLQVNQESDLSRQIVKSDSASLSIPELDFEIPPTAQQGNVSTLEGILKCAASNLEILQPERLRLGDLENFYRCKGVIERLRHFAGEATDDPENNETDQFFFHVVVDDPAGNSFIENFLAPKNDPRLTMEKYDRSPKQDMALGLQPPRATREVGSIDDSDPMHNTPNNDPNERNQIHMHTTNLPNQTCIGRQEAVAIATPCPNCQEAAETKMCVTDIPHFKEIVIMSLVCYHCAYHSSDIKPGGAIPECGTKITLSIQSPQDLQRDLLLGDTAGIEIPELELELGEGGLGGVYTTVEGLLKKMLASLKQANPFAFGDATEKHHLTNNGGEFSTTPLHVKYRDFLTKLENVGEGRIFPVTLVLNDPLSNSFVGPMPENALEFDNHTTTQEGDCNEKQADDGLVVSLYERTRDQNEALGLNNMKTENYSPSLKTNYGTDRMEPTVDAQPFARVGPDHPHQTAKAPVSSDTTIMGNQ